MSRDPMGDGDIWMALLKLKVVIFPREVSHARQD